MSENAITRRSFLAGSAGVAALAAGAGFMSFGAWEQASLTNPKPIVEFPDCLHPVQLLCSSKCGYKAYVKDGHLSKMIGMSAA